MEKYNSNNYFLINKLNDTEKTLFCNEKVLENIKVLFKNNCEVPILINGQRGIGKKHLVINCIHHIPYIDNIIKYNKLKKYKHETIDNILYYSNFYYINFKLYDKSLLRDILSFIIENFSSRLCHLDKRVFLLANINCLHNDELKILGYFIEKNYADNCFILTTNRNIIDSKINTLCCKIRYSYLKMKEFKKVLLNCVKINYASKGNRETLSNSIKKFGDKLYQIYENNNYNIGYTLYQINQLVSQNMINSVELGDRKNLLSIYDKICTKTINKILLYKKSPKQIISSIHLDIYSYCSINIDETTFVLKIVNILLKLKISDKRKNKIVDASSKFSKDVIKSEKKIFCVENFILNLIDIMN